MSRSLILVKHSLPALEPGVPSCEWLLSEVGRARCIPLAERLAAYRAAVVVASPEPKATETGQIVAARLDLPMEVIAGLHENDRTGLGWLGSAELEATIARFFAQPERRSMGNETAVGAVCARHPYETIVVVAHGAVITLFISRLTGQEPFPLWKRLGLPSFIVLSLPDHTVRTIRDDLEAG